MCVQSVPVDLPVIVIIDLTSNKLQLSRKRCMSTMHFIHAEKTTPQICAVRCAHRDGRLLFRLLIDLLQHGDQLLLVNPVPPRYLTRPALSGESQNALTSDVFAPSAPFQEACFQLAVPSPV